MAELESSRQKTLPARANASFPQVINSVDTCCNIPLGRCLVHRKFKMLCLGISTIHTPWHEKATVLITRKVKWLDVEARSTRRNSRIAGVSGNRNKEWLL
jgi:hypothetical protein